MLGSIKKEFSKSWKDCVKTNPSILTTIQIIWLKKGITNTRWQ